MISELFSTVTVLIKMEDSESKHDPEFNQLIQKCFDAELMKFKTIPSDILASFMYASDLRNLNNENDIEFQIILTLMLD